MNKRFLFAVIYCSTVMLLVSGMIWFKSNSNSNPKYSNLKAVNSQNLKQPEFLNFTPVLPDLDNIFSVDHSWTATLSADRLTKILVTGDILPARSVNAGVIRRNNPLWPYEKVIPFINTLNPDLVFVNLETPLLKDCPATNEGMIFCGSDRNIAGLQAIGTDIVGIANNHTGNHGDDGIQETITHIESAGMNPVGSGGPVYKTVSGTVFAFLAFNDIEKLPNTINPADESLILSQIRDAGQKADVVIVQHHWGTEYRSQPDERQKYLARFTIDSGADLIVSNHPHWIQPVEIYNGKFIMYAHGNFIFDQMWSEETKKGVLGMYTFYDDRLIDVEFFPVYISDYGQASFAENTMKTEILQDMKEESLLLQSD